MLVVVARRCRILTASATCARRLQGRAEAFDRGRVAHERDVHWVERVTGGTVGPESGGHVMCFIAAGDFLTFSVLSVVSGAALPACHSSNTH